MPCAVRRIWLSCFMKRDRGVKDKGGDGGGICSLGRKMCARNFTCQPAPSHQPPEPASETSNTSFCHIFSFFCYRLLVIWNRNPETFFLSLWRDFVGSIWKTGNIVFEQLCALFFLSMILCLWFVYVCVYSPIRLFAYEAICIGNVYPRINVPVIDFSWNRGAVECRKFCCQ